MAGKDKKTAASDAPEANNHISVSTYAVAGDGSKNYITAPMVGEVPKTMPFLIGRDGKLYVRKDIVPAGSKGFEVVIRLLA